MVEPRAVGGLDRVVVARGLVEREQQRPVLAERVDGERELAAQRLAVAGLVVGERDDRGQQLVEQAGDDAGSPSKWR